MSSFVKNTLNPNTGTFEPAAWIDDHFGRHNYGVKFLGNDTVYDPSQHSLLTDDKKVDSTWYDFFPKIQDTPEWKAPAAKATPPEKATPPKKERMFFTRIDPELYAKAKEIAIAEDRSIQNVIRRLLRKAVEEYDAKK